MCGIAGIYQRKGLADQQTATVVQGMTEMMTHRGPDAGRVFHDGSACLGHRRLAIIDLDPRSDQPFIDHTGRYVLVFNGQIYNFREIRKELSYPFSTTSDTEVIVAAYAQWGVKCLEKFNGMFAFVIYDRMENVLFVARDRFGVKPLYYSINQDRFMFASEIRPLLASGMIEKRIHAPGMMEFLMFQSTVCPNTIIEGIHQIRPAHYALITETGFEEIRYWTYGSTSTEKVTSYPEACKLVRRLLSESIERRMISDVPLGAFLSGGIDSSAIVALMSEVTEHVNTFSITFEEKEYDESPFSGLIAKKYQTTHHPILLRAQDLLDELPNALQAMDSPSVDGMNLYVISKMTKAGGMTVAMSGLGADELFAGYHYFPMWRKMKRFGFFALPRALRLVLAKQRYGSQDDSRIERMHQLADSDGSMAETYPVFRQVSGTQKAMELTNQQTLPSVNPLTAHLQQYPLKEFPLLSQLSIAELSAYTLNVLLKDTDQFSMASALEVRDPFFDHHLVDAVVKMPDAWKLGTRPKRLLTDAMGSSLPEEIVCRPKRGFILPWESWLRKDLHDFAGEHISFLADMPQFNGHAVQAVWKDFNDSTQQGKWPYVWQLISIAHWMRTNLT